MQNTMKATLIVNGKEFPIEIYDPKLIEEITPPKETGYERVEADESYYYMDDFGVVVRTPEDLINIDNSRYEAANYYSNIDIASGNARADKLMRKLRRFAVENGGIPDIADWQRGEVKDKFTIYYNYDVNRIEVGRSEMQRYLGDIYFHSRFQAEKAVTEFKDELIWYFTEYKDSL